MIDYVILMGIGLVAGLFGGLLGVGGSVVMIPGMTVAFGAEQHLYQGAAMIVNFFVVVPAVLQHRKAGAILTPVVRVMIPTAIIGVLLGVWISSGSWFAGKHEIRLARVFGIFLFYVAAYNIYRLFNSRRLSDVTNEQAAEMSSWRVAGTVGLPMGIVAGLLGIGGGALAVPFQQLFLRIPLRRAIANSAATILALSLIGAAYKNYTNYQVGISLKEAGLLALCLMPTAFIGGAIGAKLTHIIPRRALRTAFICLVLYAGYHMLIRAPRERTPQLPVAVPTQPVGREVTFVDPGETGGDPSGR